MQDPLFLLNDPNFTCQNIGNSNASPPVRFACILYQKPLSFANFFQIAQICQRSCHDLARSSRFLGVYMYFSAMHNIWDSPESIRALSATLFSINEI